MKPLKPSLDTLRRRIRKWIDYCIDGVWNDRRNIWYVGLIKTANLSVRSYLDKNIQSRASALTYYTLLAVVPVLALILAIARGFGFQNLIREEIFSIFPQQTSALQTVLGFVDKYLESSTGGIFIGFGILFLLWTLISLLRNIELTFNHVWGVKKGRGWHRILTDYTTIIIVLPILMICSAGISLMMSNFVQSALAKDFEYLSPVVRTILDWAPFFLTCMVFAAMYALIPYTKVKFRYALISGFICGTLFRILQTVFVGSQMYVTKYNAIYGSFSFLPLFMIWMYMTWVIIIAGVVLTYSAQNIFRFSYINKLDAISQRYYNKLAVYTFAIIVGRFEAGQAPLTKHDMMTSYNLPLHLLNNVLEKLVDAGMVSTVVTADESTAYQPARSYREMTISDFLNRFSDLGESDFINELADDAIIKHLNSSITATDCDNTTLIELYNLAGNSPCSRNGMNNAG